MNERHSKPRLVLLNQMAGPLTWELAEDLAEHLGPIVLLTGHPDTLAKGSQPNLTLYPSVMYQRASFVRRFWSWCRYLVHAFFWMWRWPADVPVLLFSNPPILVWLGWWLRRLRGTKFAVMVHDVHPDVIVRLGHLRESSWGVRVWRWLNRRAYQRAELVMTLTQGMATELRKQFDVARSPAGKIPVIYPWADTRRILPRPKIENDFAIAQGQVGKLTILYSGNMGLGHDLETMLKAANILRDDPAFHFLFVGSGPKWETIRDGIRNFELSNATILGWQPEERLPDVLASADVAVVSLETELAGLAIPSKSFYCLAAGSPLIVLCESNGDLGQLVQENHCGWHVRPGDVTRFVEILHSLRDHPLELAEYRQNSRAAASRISTRRGNTLAIETLLRQHLMASDSRCSSNDETAEKETLTATAAGDDQ